MQIACITIDCSEPGALAGFWAEVLDWTLHRQDDTAAYCAPPDGTPGLEFIKVSEPKRVKNRVHLGLYADDVDAEVTRLERLGATVAWEEDLPTEWPYRNVVLRDPEGNEFCLGDQPPH